eukprot:gene32994-44142_t
MDIYLPIANLSVNAIVIVLLGGGVGFLSGMFGIGGGFLTTPLLIIYGIPPTVAAASSASQVTGASVSGVFAHLRRGGVDFKMGGVLVAGGMVGSILGGWIFKLLQASGQIDTVIAVIYVLLLGSIGSMMAREAWTAIRATHGGPPPRARKRRHHPLIAALPLRTRFYASGLYISPLAPLLLGFGVGILTILLGVGGGFILVPAMLYLLGMGTQVVVGTSLFQTLFVTATATMVHATTTKAVDIVLAALLLFGSVAGAQVGARFASRVKPEYLRMALAVIVLLVAVRILLGLTWRPDEIFSVDARYQPAPPPDLPQNMLDGRSGGGAGWYRSSAMPKYCVALLLAPLLMGQARPAPKPILVPDVSQRDIEIAYSFTGADLLLFGAILYPGGRLPDDDKPADIVVVIKGPSQPILLREKAKVAGIWVNAARLRYSSAPSFYAIASSRPVNQPPLPRTTKDDSATTAPE